MYHTCICSTIDVKTNESLSNSVNDYFYLLNGLRENVRFPLLSHCSCCEFSINPSILYASRHSNLIRISSTSRKLFFVGNRNRLPNYDTHLGCTGQLPKSIWHRGVSGKVVRGVKEKLWYEDREQNKKRHQTCAPSDAEAMLSFLTEELGENDCGPVRVRIGSSSRRVQSKEGRGVANKYFRRENKYDLVERKSLRNWCCEEEKEEFSSHPIQKVRKCSPFRKVSVKLTEGVLHEGFRKKNKVDLLKNKSTIELESPKFEPCEQENTGVEMNEDSTNCQNHMEGNTVSSSSSYYSLSPMGVFENDVAEVQIKHGGSVEDSPRRCIGYLGTSVEAVKDEDQERDNKSSVHVNEAAMVQDCSAGAGSLLRNWQKKSEKKHSEMSTNEIILKKEFLEKESKAPLSQQKCSKLDFNQLNMNNRGKNLLLDSNLIKGTGDDNRQKVGYICDYKTTKLAEKRNTDTSEEHGRSSSSNQQSVKLKGHQKENDTVVLCSEINVPSDSQTQPDFLMNNMEGNLNLDFNSWAKSGEQHSRSNQKTIELTEPRKVSQSATGISSSVQSMDADGELCFKTFDTTEKGTSSQDSYFTPVLKPTDVIKDKHEMVDEMSLRIESIKKLPKPYEISSSPNESLSLMDQTQLGGIVSSQPMIIPPLSQLFARASPQELQDVSSKVPLNIISHGGVQGSVTSCSSSSLHFVSNSIEKVYTEVTSEIPEGKKSDNSTSLYKDKKHRQKSQSNGSKGSSDGNPSFNDLSKSLVVTKPRSSLWNIFADIIRWQWSSHGKSSSNESVRSDAWFSGHEFNLNSGDNISQRKQDRSLRTKGKKLVDSWRSSEKKIVHSSELDIPSSSEDISSSISLSNTAFCSPIVGETLKTGKYSVKPMEKSDSAKQVELLGTEGKNGELKRWKLQRSNQAQKDSFDEWEETFKLESKQRKFDEMFMREALLEAKKAADTWEVPVGAVLVQNGKIIARGCNLVEELRDSTAHAEIICIREASNLLRSWRLAETTLYVTLEPCPMCAGAILQARIDTLVWGAPNKLLGADGSWIRLFPSDGVDGKSGSEVSDKHGAPTHPFHPKMVIRRGILQSECADAMQQFFHLRKRNRERESSSSNPSVAHHPSKSMSRFHNIFQYIFCL